MGHLSAWAFRGCTVVPDWILLLVLYRHSCLVFPCLSLVLSFSTLLFATTASFHLYHVSGVMLPIYFRADVITSVLLFIILGVVIYSNSMCCLIHSASRYCYRHRFSCVNTYAIFFIVAYFVYFFLSLFLFAGVQIADVAEDSTTALCEDSCTFADDGQCDEPGVVSNSDDFEVQYCILIPCKYGSSIFRCIENFDNDIQY